MTIFAQDKLVSSITKEDFEPPTSPEDEVRTKKCCHFNICRLVELTNTVFVDICICNANNNYMVSLLFRSLNVGVKKKTFSAIL